MDAFLQNQNLSAAPFHNVYHRTLQVKMQYMERNECRTYIMEPYMILGLTM